MTPRLWQTTATDVEDWTQKLRVHVSASCIALTQYTRIQKITNSQVNYFTFPFISILLQFFCRWLLKEPVVCGGGSEKSRFSSPDVQSDVLSPFHMMHVSAFSTVQQCTEENTLRFASFPSMLLKSK